MGEDQTISSWISDVKNTAYRLSGVGVTVLDDDVILALCEGLPTSYLMLIVTLDSLPPDELTLDNVVTRLLNEEVRQKPDRDEKYPSADQALVARNKVRQPMSEITCFTCGGKGALSVDLPFNSAATRSTTGHRRRCLYGRRWRDGG
jgi:hypothetical protein